MASAGVAPAIDFSGHDGSRGSRGACEPRFAGGAGRGELEREAEPPGDAITGFVEILGQVAAHGEIGMQGRQRVDEPEELDADQRVVERGGDEAGFPPARCGVLGRGPFRSKSSRPISVVRVCTDWGEGDRCRPSAGRTGACIARGRRGFRLSR